MSVQRDTAPKETATLRRYVLPTELGPCTVRVQECTEGPPPAGGTADVYLHGAAGSWTSFLPLLSVEPARPRVIIDLPGWGESTKGARLELFGIEAMARAVTGVLHSLGYRRWNLVGHSMGGFLALHIAAAWPERTASVAAISAGTFSVADVARRPLHGLSRFPTFAGMLLLMRSMSALGAAGDALVHAVGTTPVMGLLMSPFFANPAAISRRVLHGLGDDARPAGFALPPGPRRTTTLTTGAASAARCWRPAETVMCSRLSLIWSGWPVSSRGPGWSPSRAVATSPILSGRSKYGG
ncbi:alpha/beta fold hydrolase [Arthrobacter sp. OVS8]|nr:alpha/beta fold hydrolase [Arthrobacter sp. OVS8]